MTPVLQPFILLACLGPAASIDLMRDNLMAHVFLGTPLTLMTRNCWCFLKVSNILRSIFLSKTHSGVIWESYCACHRYKRRIKVENCRKISPMSNNSSRFFLASIISRQFAIGRAHDTTQKPSPMLPMRNTENVRENQGITGKNMFRFIQDFIFPQVQH